MYLEIISPEKQMFAGDIRVIKLPGSSGSFEIMENHAPVISTLIKGKVKVKETNGIISYFEISGGLVEAAKNEIRVLVEA